MKASSRFSTSSERMPCLASSAEVVRPAAPAPTIKTGTCATLISGPFYMELISSAKTQCVTSAGGAQPLTDRRAAQRQNHVFEHAADVDPVKWPPGDHPQHI